MPTLRLLYKQVLGIELPWLDEIEQAKVARRSPVVLTPREMRDLLQNLNGTLHPVVSLFYGAGRPPQAWCLEKSLQSSVPRYVSENEHQSCLSNGYARKAAPRLSFRIFRFR